MTAPAPRRIQRFDVLAVLGTGGMGTVYRAHDPQLDRDVAIKVLRGASSEAATAPGLSLDNTVDLRGDAPAARDDLLREARMMARLSHPNVLPVYEVGIAEGSLFFVMEYIPGRDLATWLAERPSRPAILDVFLQAGRGLAAAHEQGIVHRDFKPANVLIGRDGRARVADFGLSKVAARSAGSMVPIDDAAGTPRYMAPELWGGASATTSSDVYAFCTALDEALGGERDDPPDERERRWREYGLPPRLRTLMAAGLAETPEARPALVHVLAAIDHRPGRRAWWLAGAAALVLGAAGVVVAAAPGDDATACEPDRSRFAGVWDDGRRAVLRASLETRATPDARHFVDLTLANLDDARQVLDEHAAATCQAVRDGKLAKQQQRVREACFERRVFELEATVDRIGAGIRDVRWAHGRAQNMGSIADCLDLTIAPDNSALRPLYERYIRSHELATPTTAVAHLRELREIEAEAQRLGDAELGARAAFQQSFEERFQDMLAQADASLTRVYKVANEIGARTLAADALVERSSVAAFQNDAAAAKRYAELARDLADKPSAPVLTRARIYSAIGRAHQMSGDYKAAIDQLRHGLDLMARSGKRNARIEADLRFSLVGALTNMEGQQAAAVEAARATVETIRELHGERDPNYGVALNMLAAALSNANDHRGALQYRREALAQLRETMPGGNARIAIQRSELADDLLALGDFEAARTELRGVLAAGEKSEQVSAIRMRVLVQLGRTTFQLGEHDEGVRLIEQAREESTSQHGKDHPDTLDYRFIHVDLLLELGRLAIAERELALLDKGYRTKPEDNRLAVVRLSGILQATLANLRGRPVEGERLARESLLQWDQLAGPEPDRVDLQRVLGEALIAQERWEDAYTELEQALARARRIGVRDDVAAAIEVDLARTEHALGTRAAAIARARGARAVLDRYPGQIRARAAAAALLARK